jgi:hypothetical protein
MAYLSGSSSVRVRGLVGILGLAATAWGQPSGQPAGRPGEGPPPLSGAPGTEPLDWRTLESPLLTGHVQLTSREAFVKAGEAYFSPDSSWIIFQAVPVPASGQEPDPVYSMYVAKVVHDASGGIAGIDRPVLISPPGSANTCGWFDPANDGRVIFGSTLTRPAHLDKPGFKVGTNKYAWSFPEETEVVGRLVPQIGGTLGAAMDAEPSPLFARPDYDAECSYSPDGRYILYSHVEKRDQDGNADADIWIFDTKTGEQHPIVQAPGYDGGPFFSPDGACITYRSDRRGNSLLQLFVAKLKKDAGGVPVGVEWERALTDNQNVNWCPYWHPSGKFLVFAGSEIGHFNYEVFAVEVGAALLRGDAPAGEARRARVTFANGADVLPAFSPDGRWMMWTAQRGPIAEGESKPSSQIWVAKVGAGMSVDALFPPAQPSSP